MNITNMLYFLLGLLVLKGVSGLQRACIDGKYGKRCDLKCTFADNCKNRICASDGTRCHYGCIDGKYGEICENECPSYLCFGNSCNSATGKCDSCPQGKYGSYCTKDCPSTCQTCHRDTGACTDTSLDGVYVLMMIVVCIFFLNIRRRQAEDSKRSAHNRDGSVNHYADLDLNSQTKKETKYCNDSYS